ncbi:MAG: hypothetical protein ACHQ49_02030 [Elusimicrobiota bacterium]
MVKSIRPLFILMFAARVALGAVIGVPVALPPSAVPGALGASIGAAALQTTGGIPLQSAALTFAPLDQIHQPAPALAVPPAALPAPSAAIGVPAAGKIVSAAAPVQDARERPESVLPAGLVSTYRSFLDVRKDDAASIPASSAENAVAPRQALRRGAPGNANGNRSRPTFEKASPLPPANRVDSTLASLDEAVEMYVSHSYPGKIGVDPAVKISEEVDKYIVFKGMPDSEKHFVFKYFEIGDPPSGHSPVVSAIERLVKAGIKTTILTDINQGAVGTFAGGEPQNTDFEHVTYKGSPGRALKYLRETLGFGLKFGEGKFTILSGVPLFNPRDKSEKPLMHDKGVFAQGPGGKAYEFAWSGTANMNATEDSSGGDLPAFGGRYNRVMRSKDPVANQADWNHVLGEIAAYDKRLSSKGLSDDLNVPQRVDYPNGESREIAFTNGKQNPNDRITDAFNRAAKALVDAKANGTQPDFEIDETIFSHFVLTATPEVDAFRAYLDALREFYPNDFQTRMKVFGVFDQQFISPDGFGEAAAFDGLLVQRPMGKSIFPFRTEYMAMMKLYGYLRLLVGAGKVDSESAPTNVHLWHDKTTMMKVRERNPKTGQMEAWTYVWTRSLNDSGHYQSLESQDMYRMRPDSALAKSFEDSIKEVVKAEPQYAVDMDKAIVATVLAHMTRHTPYDAGMLEHAANAIAALVKEDYRAVGAVLTEIAGAPTKNVKSFDAAEIEARVAQFVAFLEWYRDESAKDASWNKMTYRKAINVGVALASNNPWGMRGALDILFYSSRRAKDQNEQLMKRAWTEGLKMAAPYPEPKSPRSNS